MLTVLCGLIFSLCAQTVRCRLAGLFFKLIMQSSGLEACVKSKQIFSGAAWLSWYRQSLHVCRLVAWEKPLRGCQNANCVYTWNRKHSPSCGGFLCDAEPMSGSIDAVISGWGQAGTSKSGHNCIISLPPVWLFCSLLEALPLLAWYAWAQNYILGSKVPQKEINRNGVCWRVYNKSSKRASALANVRNKIFTPESSLVLFCTDMLLCSLSLFRGPERGSDIRG